MRWWGRSIATAIVIAGVVGVMGWPAPGPPAAQLSEPTCVGYLHGVPAGAILDPQHDTGGRPSEFETVTVVRCEPAAALIPDQEVTRVRMTTFTLRCRGRAGRVRQTVAQGHLRWVLLLLGGLFGACDRRVVG